MAARHKDGQWAMVYLGGEASFSIEMSKITAAKEVEARWIDPRTGESVAIGRFSNTGVESFSTPLDGKMRCSPLRHRLADGKW